MVTPYEFKSRRSHQKKSLLSTDKGDFFSMIFVPDGTGNIADAYERNGYFFGTIGAGS